MCYNINEISQKGGILLYTEGVMEVICIIGVIAFAVSGAMAAIKKRADPFGVAVLAVLTATGGGIIRDSLLGIQPPAVFIDCSYVLIAASVALTVFLIAYTHKDAYRSKTALIDRINNIFDALGLGVFVVIGTQTAIDYGYSQNMFLAVFIGTVTGVGGSFLRDITVCEIPAVMCKHVYALAALSGSMMFYVMYINKFDYTLSAFLSAGAVFVLRMFATHFKWNLPHAY